MQSYCLASKPPANISECKRLPLGVRSQASVLGDGGDNFPPCLAGQGSPRSLAAVASRAGVLRTSATRSLATGTGAREPQPVFVPLFPAIVPDGLAFGQSHCSRACTEGWGAPAQLALGQAFLCPEEGEAATGGGLAGRDQSPASTTVHSQTWRGKCGSEWQPRSITQP